jgi:hypothetical protein
LRLTRKRVLIASAAALLAIGGFAFGFFACLYSKSAPNPDLRELQLLQPGDAPATVRAGVLASLRAFQEGYVQRNPGNLDSFMTRLFPRDGQVLLLGTEGGTAEWVRGYPATAQFIQDDWRDWGDFRFDVDHSIICSSGDVAWVATVGSVNFKGSKRPLRFSATLTRNGDNWIFRQMQFQWDDQDPEASAVFHLRTYFRLARLALRRFTLNVGR